MRLKCYAPLVLGLALTLSPSLTTLEAAETFAIDPEKSSIAFTIQNKPPNAAEFQEVPGRFTQFSGQVTLDAAAPEKSTVLVEVDTASVDTENTKRDDHLRNQDFFKVKEFPKMRFQSTGVRKQEDGSYEVKGNFTLLGKSKPLTITFTPTENQDGGTTSFTIKRSDHGMTYRLPDTADEVKVTLNLLGKKQP